MTVNTNSNSSPPSKTNLLRLVLFLFENSMTSLFVGIFVIRNFFLFWLDNSFKHDDSPSLESIDEDV